MLPHLAGIACLSAAAVALAHGLHCSRIDGLALVYNQADVYMPDLLICRKEHAAMVLGHVSELAA